MENLDIQNDFEKYYEFIVEKSNKQIDQVLNSLRIDLSGTTSRNDKIKKIKTAIGKICDYQNEVSKACKILDEKINKSCE